MLSSQGFYTYIQSNAIDTLMSCQRFALESAPPTARKLRAMSREQEDGASSNFVMIESTLTIEVTNYLLLLFIFNNPYHFDIPWICRQELNRSLFCFDRLEYYL